MKNVVDICNLEKQFIIEHIHLT